MSKSDIIQLRPHHLLCTRFFEGKGYSSDFTVHMTETIERLQAGAQVRLVDGADEICGSCPNMQKGRCITQEKVVRYDAGVLEHTGLACGDTLDYRELYRLIGERIIEQGTMGEICGDCSWSDICYRK